MPKQPPQTHQLKRSISSKEQAKPNLNKWIANFFRLAFIISYRETNIDGKTQIRIRISSLVILSLSSGALWANHSTVTSTGITRWELYLSWLSLNVSWGVFFSFVLSFVFFSRNLSFMGIFLFVSYFIYFILLFDLLFALKSCASSSLLFRILLLLLFSIAKHAHLVES